MLWQDFVIAAGSLVFVFALIPSMLSKDKPALSTSITTGIVLFIFSFTYITLSLWFSAATTTLTGIAWAILAIQKVLKSKASRKR